MGLIDMVTRLCDRLRFCEFNSHSCLTPYFSLVGGASPFNRRYIDSAEYCSLSCDTFPHSTPALVRFAGPTESSSVKFASVVEPYALSHSAKDAFNPATIVALRSEEHTSELQSRRDLVCRLLLEK